jgi:multidrug efflux system membrane fusion protein
LIATRKDVVVIPDAAVQRGPDKLFAYVVNADDRIERRDLNVAEIQDGQAVITSGIKAGDRVVTSGYYRLEPGSAVDLPNGTEEKKEPNRTTASDRGSQKASRSPEVE